MVALRAERDARMAEVTAAAEREGTEMRKMMEAVSEREAAGTATLRAMLAEAREGAAAEAGRVREAVRDEVAARLAALEAEHDEKLQVRDWDGDRARREDRMYEGRLGGPGGGLGGRLEQSREDNGGVCQELRADHTNTCMG